MFTKSRKVYQINKNRYLRGLHCHKALWLEIRHPELMQTDGIEYSNRQFQQLKTLAQGIFPGGYQIPSEGLSNEERLNLTELALRRERIIYDACFRYHGGLVVV